MSIVRTLLASSLVLTALATTTACTSETSDVASGEDDITAAKASDEWFYSGPLPALDSPNVTVSLDGHTAHVTGYLPAGFQLGELPHVKQRDENGKRRVDIVYPIATARPEKTDSKPGGYALQTAMPYRPNGAAWTPQEGDHQVTWGGFPFLAYNDGIAFHGPITFEDNKTADVSVWYLRRGDVSGGCNRMMGEHVVELAHILGISMRKIYGANVTIPPPSAARVTVIDGYDTLDGKYIDVDYPTDTGMRRPGLVYGPDKVVMFGSWVATEMPDGKDLPPDMKWEGGVSGKPYVFLEHARQGVVCSMPKPSLPALKAIAAKRPNGELPADFCAKKMACDAHAGRICAPNEIPL